MAQQRNDNDAFVTNSNEKYDRSRIVEDGTNAIHSPEEDAIAAIKGHIEKQDEEK
ncbi:hypothetical protein RAC89_13625 [Paenibacillus sp. GD4]|jgi:hypothetical protein|uniref:hypothetical protein n=1 Tax=Paenibacillus TaxID=44249 RepID=UPI00254360A6|nr:MULTISPECIES: hypothetical protein [Paenibacillus]MDQ1911475.1 hypothetical protein [Paenibacillus sp. GD4]